VHCVGQPFALVIADSQDAAWQAARLIDADWEPLTAILDAGRAAEAGALIGPPRTIARGDVDAAWADCTTVVEGSVRLGSADHVYLETQCALAVPVDDGLVVHSATQSPSAVQAAVARVTGLPMNAVEVDVVRLGGGFGGKEDQATEWACCAALAAVHTGRPVRVWLDRTDDLQITGKRHACTADYRLGLGADGRFLAYQATLYLDGGCATDLSPAILERSLCHATNAYAVPHVRVTGVSCRTNLPANTAFRGFGAPQGIFVFEAAIRTAAHALGVPPEELQARNLLTDGDVLPYGQVIESSRGVRTWAELVAIREPQRLRAAIDDWNATGPRVRRGMGMVPICFGIAFTASQLNQAEALVHVYLDGTVTVTTGAVEMGQGVNGKLRTVVARTLGIGEDAIRVQSTNTLRVANLSPTAASTGADLNGGAVREACLSIVADLPDGDVWLERVQAAYAQRRSLSALAHYATPGLSFDHTTNQGEPFRYHVFGAALVEAEVDVLLGTGRIERVTLVHDNGESLDELTDRGQIEGALVQGIGWMTTEEVRRDAKGRLLTDTLATYKVPDLPDAPEIDVHLLGELNPLGLLNSKAVGEPPLVYGLGAFFALQDAIASYAPGAAGVFTAPLTAERIFCLLHGVGDDHA
jgi:xanthine dehydrogenase large subunit